MIYFFYCVVSRCLEAAQAKSIYRHVPIMLCGSCSQIHAHRYWFSPQFFFSLQCNPLFISLSPCHGVWGENQLTACERAQRIQRERRLPHNLDLFSFICYLSATAALLQTIILLCVGWMWRYVGKHALAVHPSTHTNTVFSTGHLTHFSVWITRLQPIMGRRNGKKLEKDATSSLSHVRVPNLPVDTVRQGWWARERESLSLLSPSLPLPSHLHHTGTSRTITHPPQPPAQGCAEPMAALPM